MDNADWTQFADYIEEVTKLPGSWQEKKLMLEEQLKENNALEEFEEILSWYGKEN